MADADFLRQEKRSSRARRLSLIMGLGALVLGFRLFDLQVLGVEEYTLQSERNRIRREWVAAPRGLVEDRNGVVLADTRPSFTVLAVPGPLLEREHSLLLLSELLDVDKSDVEERLESVASHLPRVVRRDVGFEQVSRIAEREEELPGVSLEVTNVRSYPQGALATQLLGRVGEISQEEVSDLADEGYRVGDFLGRTGIEKVYESDLRGIDGEKYLEVDAVGKVVGEFAGRDPVPPQTGSTLRLHLDAKLQAVAESLLAGHVGAISILDAQTGGVRVMASGPTFDPNLFATGIGKADWEKLNTDPGRPLLNRNVQAQYAPGSTFKPVSFVVTLENGIFPYRKKCETPCYGSYLFGNRRFGCWEDLGHGRVDLETALVVSCDVYFYQVAEQIQPDDLAAAARAGGLGARTGIDLPSEAAGLIPDNAYMDERYGKRGWTQGNVLNLVIGQGEYLVTPLQMARHFAALGNGGRLLRPRIVAEMEDEDGVTRFPPRVDATWELSARTWSRVQHALRLVVEDPEEGTARGSRVEGLTLAGKTGTAENAHGEPHSWYCGYAPAEDPEIAWAVVVEQGGHGSEAAVPMMREILKAFRGPLEGDGPT